jgi:hypothetical protein
MGRNYCKKNEKYGWEVRGNIMEKRRGINLVGLYETLSELFNRPRKPVPWGIKAKKKDELLKPGKAPAAKKRHRKMIQESRRQNR